MSTDTSSKTLGTGYEYPIVNNEIKDDLFEYIEVVECSQLS